MPGGLRPRVEAGNPELSAAARSRGAERARGAGRGAVDAGAHGAPVRRGTATAARPRLLGAKTPREGGAAAGAVLSLAPRPDSSPAGTVGSRHRASAPQQPWKAMGV